MRIEFRLRVRLIASLDDPLDKAQVQTAHHVSVVTSDHVKGTISQAFNAYRAAERRA